MPLSLEQFIQLIESEGCTYQVDQNGHYRVYWQALYVCSFAVSHGKRTKGNEVWDPYKYTFKSRIRQVKEQHRP